MKQVGKSRCFHKTSSPGRSVRAAVLLLFALSCLLLAPGLAAARSTAPRAGSASAPQLRSRSVTRSATGALTLKIIGLPRGEHATLSLTGPKSSAQGARRSLTATGVRTLHGLPAGSYRVTVARVKLRRRHQAIKRGAIASPIRRHLRIKVRPHRAAKLDVRYGTIVNPGVQSAAGAISAVIGDPTDPSAVTLKSTRGIHRGTILSAHPGASLPHGLLARVTSLIHKHGKTTAALIPVSIYDVAPNMSLDVPLSSVDAARISAALQCGPSGSSFSPYAHVSDVHLTGGWTTSRVLFANVTTGATLELHFKASAGLNVSAGAGFTCSLPLPAFSIEGMAGPIPVYGAIRPKASGEVAAQAKLHTEGSTDVTLGANIALPGTAKPIVGFGSPSFNFAAELFAGVKASLGIDAELGVGAANVASLHLAVGNSLDFIASPGKCSWDLNLGAFSAAGEVGPFSISTPSTPPLYHHNLWHQGCGAPPSAAPTPAPVPTPITLPLTRATMTWDTDSDIDLYAWDDQGNLLFYGERDGIPNAELIEDVIPLEGEDSHAPEIFRETAEPNRPYTFGICDYHREGGDVTLTVTDPNGTTRTFHRTLEYEGDSAVITMSPEGAGYSPPPEWCRHSEF